MRWAKVGGTKLGEVAAGVAGSEATFDGARPTGAVAEPRATPAAEP